MLEKKGLCKLLKSTWARGYEYVPDGRILTVNGRSWAVQCDTRDLPVDAAQQIVEHVGYMPTEAVMVQKGEANQTIIPEAAQIRIDFFKTDSGEMLKMKKIPVIFRDRWQLYQTDTGKVYGFDTEIMKVIDFKAVTPDTYMSDTGNMGIWVAFGIVVFIAPGRFSLEDTEKLYHIAALDWERQQGHEDPVGNMSLFDEDEDVDVIDADH